MKKLCIFSCLIFSFLSVFAQEKVLFVGNSLTFFNNMPQMFEQLANNKGHNIIVTQFTMGGMGLNDMQNNSDLINLFSQNWDYVILQPGTSESGGGGVGIDSLSSIIKNMCQKIWIISPCAKIFLYEISNGIYFQNNTEMWDYYFMTQPMINNVIHSVAQMTKLPYAPVGECFMAYYRGKNDLKLHNSFNDVHPNKDGSYLTALAIYNTLFEQSNQCDYYGETEENLAKVLQHISDSIVLTNKSLWLIDDFKTQVDFSYDINNNIVTFENLSTNYDNINWNINDEFVSNLNNFEYEFTVTGEKFATINIENHGCIKNLTKTFEIQVDNYINDTKNYNYIINIKVIDNVILFKNNIFNNLHYKIINISGQIVQEGKINNNIIDIQNITKGNYIITVSKNNKMISYKFIK